MTNTKNSLSAAKSIPPSPDPQPARAFPWRWLAAILALGFLVSAPSLLGGFHADDWFQVRPRSLTQVLATFSGDWNSGESAPGSLYRPLIRVGFWIDESIWGDNPFGYHLTNQAQFLAMLAGIFVVAWKLTGRSAPIAALATAWLACFPPSVEAIAWLSGRTDLQAAVGIFWSLALLLIALERASWGFLLGSMAALWAALLSKEVGIAGAAILPLAVMLFRPKDLERRFAVVAVTFPIGSGLLYLLLRSWAIPGLGGYHAIRGGTLGVEELLKSWATFPAALALPVGLRSNMAAFPMAGAAVVIGLALVFLLASRFRRGPVFCFGAFLLVLLPMAGLGVAPGREGRLLLIPAGFAAIGFASAAASMLRHATQRRVALIVGAVALLPLAGFSLADHWTWARARVANETVLEAAFAELSAHESPADFVFLEAPFDPAQGVRMPGRTGYLALQTMWQWRHPGLTQPTIHIPPGSPTDQALLPLPDGGFHRLRPALAPPSASRTIVISVQTDNRITVRRIETAKTYPLFENREEKVPFEAIGSLTLRSKKPNLQGYTLGSDGALVFETDFPPGQLVLTGEGQAGTLLGKAETPNLGEAVFAYPLDYWGIDKFFAVWPESNGKTESIAFSPALEATAFQLQSLSVTIYLYDNSVKGHPPNP